MDLYEILMLAVAVIQLIIEITQLLFRRRNDKEKKIANPVVLRTSGWAKSLIN